MGIANPFREVKGRDVKLITHLYNPPTFKSIWSHNATPKSLWQRAYSRAGANLPLHLL
jgi:hypothetical protein